MSSDLQTDVRVELPKVFLNQSRYKAFQDCDRLYAWSEVEGIEPDRPKPYLELGTAIHKAMIVAHEGKGTEDAFKDAMKTAESSFRKGMENAPKLMTDEAEIKAGVAMTNKLLRGYYQHWGSKGELWKPLGMELEFVVEVGENTGVFLVGKIDNLATFTGNLWLVDYKTMARLDLRDFLKYENDVQITAYIYGGTKQLTIDAQKRGEKPVMIRGAIIDGLIKTEVPQYYRGIYTRSIDELRVFEQEFCQKAWEIAAKHAIIKGQKDLYSYYTERIYTHGQEHGWKITFPMNTNQCFRYGTCAFRDLCVCDNSDRRVMYRPRHFDYVERARKQNEGSYKAWEDPEFLAAHVGREGCTDPECTLCSYRDCPNHDTLHYSASGCPSCTEENQKAASIENEELPAPSGGEEL